MYVQKSSHVHIEIELSVVVRLGDEPLRPRISLVVLGRAQPRRELGAWSPSHRLIHRVLGVVCVCPVVLLGLIEQEESRTAVQAGGVSPLVNPNRQMRCIFSPTRYLFWAPVLGARCPLALPTLHLCTSSCIALLPEADHSPAKKKLGLNAQQK